MNEKDLERLAVANQKLVALLTKLTRMSDESMGLDSVLQQMSLHLLTQTDILRKWEGEIE